MNALRSACGALIIGGFSGTSLPASFARALAAEERGGAILFGRNLRGRSGEEMLRGVEELVRAIAEAARDAAPPLVGIDQEGGRVARLGPPALVVPPMRRLAALSLPEVQTVARAQGRELAALGITMNFAPVLDVDSNPANPVIGDRAFGSDPAAVAALGLAYAAGLREGGVVPCGKHFPGHGDTALDSHLALPRVAAERARLDRVELAPFAASARATAGHAALEAWMTAHVVFDALDPAQPATLSKAVLTDLARGELGFEGALISDDLEMRAVSERASPGELAVATIAAGCDVILVCSREEAQDEAFVALVRAAESSTTFRARVQEAAGRSAALRATRRWPVSGEERARVFAQSDDARRILERLQDRPAGSVAGFDPTEQGRT